MTMVIGASLQLPATICFPHGTSAGVNGDITVDAESLSSEITAVSLPYVNELGAVTGALVVLAPTYRMSPLRVETEIVPALRYIMQRQVTPLHDRAEARYVPLFLHSGREISRYPQLVTGMSSSSADAGRLSA